MLEVEAKSNQMDAEKLPEEKKPAVISKGPVKIGDPNKIQSDMMAESTQWLT